MDWITDPQIWIALGTLTFLEIVLGVDNIIFISILSGKLPPEQQATARRVGLLGAMLTRILLLFSLAWIIKLTAPLFTLVGHAISGRDLILILGGLFLIGKSTYEIHDKLEGEEGHALAEGRRVVRQRDRPDHAARHRVLARLGHHRGRDGRRGVGDDRRGGDRRSR